MNIYENTVNQFINSDLFNLEDCRINLYTQLGLVAVHSQFTERQLFSYSFLMDSLIEQDISEIELKLQSFIDDEKFRLKAYAERENPYSQFREALKYFNNSIPIDKKYVTLVENTIKNRDYLIHRCVIDNPTLIYDIEKIEDLTRKAIYCTTILTQITHKAEEYFMETITNKYPVIGEKLIELIKVVNTSINKV